MKLSNKYLSWLLRNSRCLIFTWLKPNFSFEYNMIRKPRAGTVLKIWKVINNVYCLPRISPKLYVESEKQYDWNYLCEKWIKNIQNKIQIVKIFFVRLQRRLILLGINERERQYWKLSLLMVNKEKTFAKAAYHSPKLTMKYLWLNEWRLNIKHVSMCYVLCVYILLVVGAKVISNF